MRLDERIESYVTDLTAMLKEYRELKDDVDQIDDLQSRLDILRTDLDDALCQIVDTLEERYRELDEQVDTETGLYVDG